jgi:HEAT repeat protein
LLPFIADADENVALHAIVAFGNDTPEKVVRDLVQELVTADRRRTPAVSEALRQIGNETVVRALIEAAAGGSYDWVVATLGRLPPALARPAVEDSAAYEASGSHKRLREFVNAVQHNVAEGVIVESSHRIEILRQHVALS